MRAEVYTKPNCPFCTKAKALLNEKGYAITEFDVNDETIKKMLLEQVPGARMVPQIFVEGDYVGGYDALLDYFDNTKQMLRG